MPLANAVRLWQSLGSSARNAEYIHTKDEQKCSEEIHLDQCYYLFYKFVLKLIVFVFVLVVLCLEALQVGGIFVVHKSSEVQGTSWGKFSCP